MTPLRRFIVGTVLPVLFLAALMAVMFRVMGAPNGVWWLAAPGLVGVFLAGLFQCLHAQWKERKSFVA